MGVGGEGVGERKGDIPVPHYINSFWRVRKPALRYLNPCSSAVNSSGIFDQDYDHDQDKPLSHLATQFLCVLCG